MKHSCQLVGTKKNENLFSGEMKHNGVSHSIADNRFGAVSLNSIIKFDPYSHFVVTLGNIPQRRLS
jgi:hypothetical protein